MFGIVHTGIKGLIKRGCFLSSLVPEAVTSVW